MSLSLILVLLLIPGSMFLKADKIVWPSDHFPKSDHTSILCRLACPGFPVFHIFPSLFPDSSPVMPLN